MYGKFISGNDIFHFILWTPVAVAHVRTVNLKSRDTWLIGTYYIQVDKPCQSKPIMLSCKLI